MCLWPLSYIAQRGGDATSEGESETRLPVDLAADEHGWRTCGDRLELFLGGEGVRSRLRVRRGEGGGRGGPAILDGVSADVQAGDLDGRDRDGRGVVDVIGRAREGSRTKSARRGRCGSQMRE